MATTKTTNTAGISDQAVRQATGKSWPEWFRILDAAGAGKLSHKEIAQFIDRTYPKIGGWWAQMVTVGYEQARGLRHKHERPEGFEISASKTIAAPLTKVFRAWNDSQFRRRWLPEAELNIHKSTRNKSMRITWSDGKKSVNVNFYPKGGGKSMVVVQHGKLATARAASGKKKFWTDRLSRLKSTLES